MIERQRDGPFAALPIGGAVSLGMVVSLDEGWVELEEVSIKLRAVGVFITIVVWLELPVRLLSWRRVEEESGRGKEPWSLTWINWTVSEIERSTELLWCGCEN
jgi:hypothetical protein